MNQQEFSRTRHHPDRQSRAPMQYVAEQESMAQIQSRRTHSTLNSSLEAQKHYTGLHQQFQFTRKRQASGATEAPSPKYPNMSHGTPQPSMHYQVC